MGIACTQPRPVVDHCNSYTLHRDKRHHQQEKWQSQENCEEAVKELDQAFQLGADRWRYVIVVLIKVNALGTQSL